MTLPWRLKVWSGSAWIDAELKRWNGSSWVVVNGYYWDGGAWVLITDRTPPTTTHNDTYTSTTHQTYRGNNTQRDDVNAYQGYYDGLYGIQKSMFFFAHATIDSALSGRVATYQCRVRLNNTHTYYVAGGTAVIGTHVNNSVPTNFTYNRYNSPGSFHYDRGQDKFVTVTNSLASWFDGDSAFGITLYANSTDADYYGYYSPGQTQLFFSYEK